MFQRDIDQWLQENGGSGVTSGNFYKNRQEKLVPVKKMVRGQEETSYEKHIIWTAHNGQVLDVVEPESTPSTAADQQAAVDAGRAEYAPDGSFSPNYREASRGDPDNTDARSPERKASDSATHAEAEWNRANGPTPDKNSPAYDGSGRGSGIYETHTDRIRREATETTNREQSEDRARRGRTEERQADTDAGRLEVERKRAETDAQRADTDAARNARQDEIDAARQKNEADRVKIDQARADREAKGKTQVVGSGDYRNPTILSINDTTGETYQISNPNYDPIRVEAETKREEIKLGIEAGKFSAEVGAQKYKEWYDKNVTAPIALSQERRAQSAERRQAQEAKERDEQAKRQNEIERAKVGQLASESAQANERAMLPYMTGPKFGKQFSNAINGLAAGGDLEHNAAAGVNFTADAFQFDRPNFKKIAKDATREALKNLTPYNPNSEPYAVADYTGLAMPDSTTMQGAPAGYTPSDSLMTAVNNVQASIPTYTPPNPVTPPVAP